MEIRLSFVWLRFIVSLIPLNGNVLWAALYEPSAYWNVRMHFCDMHAYSNAFPVNLPAIYYPNVRSFARHHLQGKAGCDLSQMREVGFLGKWMRFFTLEKLILPQEGYVLMWWWWHQWPNAWSRVLKSLSLNKIRLNRHFIFTFSQCQCMYKYVRWNSNCHHNMINREYCDKKRQPKTLWYFYWLQVFNGRFLIHLYVLPLFSLLLNSTEFSSHNAIRIQCIRQNYEC